MEPEPQRGEIRVRDGRRRQRFDGNSWQRLCDLCVGDDPRLARKNGLCVKHSQEVLEGRTRSPQQGFIRPARKSSAYPSAPPSPYSNQQPVRATDTRLRQQPGTNSTHRAILQTFRDATSAAPSSSLFTPISNHSREVPSIESVPYVVPPSPSLVYVDLTNFQLVFHETCLDIFESVVQHHDVWPFLKPVDTVSLGLTDYFDIIKEPMDLTTVKDRLDKRAYANLASFAYDVRLVWSNCMRYNPPNLPIHKMGKRLSQQFEKRLAMEKERLTRMHSNRFTNFCGICGMLDRANTSLEMVQCHGGCMRSFHQVCAETTKRPPAGERRDGVGYVCLDCLLGRPVYFWDPKEKRYFMHSSCHDDPASSAIAKGKKRNTIVVGVKRAAAKGHDVVKDTKRVQVMSLASLDGLPGPLHQPRWLGAGSKRKRGTDDLVIGGEKKRGGVGAASEPVCEKDSGGDEEVSNDFAGDDNNGSEVANADEPADISLYLSDGAELDAAARKVAEECGVEVMEAMSKEEKVALRKEEERTLRSGMYYDSWLCCWRHRTKELRDGTNARLSTHLNNIRAAAATAAASRMKT
eukprot:TRINITY_DN8841_c0_g1_i1.p1 TRINITY_DN8841_c0_g1~~TRINITY_DN8841_c0_g1_i1.p1  ORF type:complete len:577 (-),score=99.04 TRINITY_DN8841_c0_g1_i1:67-1797(-)